MTDFPIELLRGLIGRLGGLAAEFPDFRFVAFGGPAAADPAVVADALEAFAPGVGCAFRPDADGAFCLYGADVEGAIAAFEALADDLILGTRALQEAAAEPGPAESPIPTVRGPAAPFILIDVLVGMAAHHVQALSAEFAALGVDLGPAPPGARRVHDGPVTLDAARCLVFPGHVMCTADVAGDPAFADLAAAVARGELTARLSLSPVFAIVGGSSPRPGRGGSARCGSSPRPSW